MARYIDADLLLAEVEKQKGDFADGEGNEPLMCWEVADLINDQDTADVEEVKHGHWIKQGNEKKCSVCEFVYYSNNDDWNGCPNCLAKMDGGNKNEL